jgi:hypothetical protein
MSGAGEHNFGGDRAPGGNAATTRTRAAQRPRTRECPRRTMPHRARGNPIIDMKGRVYDPLAGRFLSADPIVQAPHWSQGLNRYA